LTAGSWFEKTGQRDKIVLATKVYAPMSDWPNDGGLSARHIVAACEASLRRLRTDWIGNDLLEHGGEGGRVDVFALAHGHGAGGLVVVAAGDDPSGSGTMAPSTGNEQARFSGIAS
jgi:hypothetical protein